MGTVAPRYEPNLIEDHALELYTRSHTARFTWGVVGAISGLVLGGFAALLLPASLPLAARAGTAALAVLGGLLAGRSIGRRRAKALRVAAQMVLCDVHAQYGTLALWRMLKDRLPAAAESWQRFALPEPQPALPAAPLPVAAPAAPIAAQIPAPVAPPAVLVAPMPLATAPPQFHTAQPLETPSVPA